MTAPRVPLIDLRAQHAPLRQELLDAVAEAADRSAFAGGPLVERFEREWAVYCGRRFAVGVGSGTQALWLSLLALGVGPGDEVVTSPLTFAATIEAIRLTGAAVVYADIDPRFGTLDPEAVEAALSGRTKAIVPVHLYGRPCDMEAIGGLARRRGVFVVEDACQAHGARRGGRRAGSWGDAACFSFYPGKNLGAWGEAGAVVTDREDLAQTLRVLRDHGQRRKNEHVRFGWNARMDGVQAAVLRVKLRRLDQWNAARARLARRYAELLGQAPRITLPEESPDVRSAWHLYVIRAPGRDALRDALARRGVQCGVHYPLPTHLQPAFQDPRWPRGSLPEAERMAETVLSLPLYPELTEGQQAFVAEQLMAVLRREPITSGTE